MITEQKNLIIKEIKERTQLQITLKARLIDNEMKIEELKKQITEEETK